MSVMNKILFYFKYLTFAGFIYAGIVLYPGLISDNIGISRNAIHKVVKNMEDKLYFYEDKLKLYSKACKLKSIIDNIDDDGLKEKLKELY